MYEVTSIEDIESVVERALREIRAPDQLLTSEWALAGKDVQHKLRARGECVFTHR